MRRRRLVTTVALAMLSLVATPGLSAPNENAAEAVAEAAARAHGERAAVLFDQGKIDEAIVEYRKAYELKADPAFLLRIAQSYEKLERLDQAQFYYRRFLSAAPNAPERAEIEKRVHGPEDQPMEAGSLLDSDAAAKSDEPRPLWKRPWLWVAVGAVAAVTTAIIVLAAQGDGGGVPATDLGHHKFF